MLCSHQLCPAAFRSRLEPSQRYSVEGRRHERVPILLGMFQLLWSRYIVVTAMERTRRHETRGRIRGHTCRLAGLITRLIWCTCMFLVIMSSISDPLLRHACATHVVNTCSCHQWHATRHSIFVARQCPYHSAVLAAHSIVSINLFPLPYHIAPKHPTQSKHSW